MATMAAKIAPMMLTPKKFRGPRAAIGRMPQKAQHVKDGQNSGDGQAHP
jgi:hypothetical protein